MPLNCIHINFNIFSLLLCGGLLWQAPAMAQQTKTPKPETVLQDTASKALTFVTRFGPYNGKTPAPLEDIKKIINGDVIVTDNKGVKWKVYAFTLGWNKIETSDDWQTGKRKTIKTFQAVELKETSKIPAAWQTEFINSLQKGEEILIQGVVVENPTTKQKRFAPDLKIKIM